MVNIILKKNTKKLGEKNKLVNVKDGYSNYLIAQGIASLANQTNKKILLENLKQNEQKEKRIMLEAKHLAKKLDRIPILFTEKVDHNHKLFGAITPIKIAKAYQAHKITLEPKQITIKNGTTKELGIHQAVVLLHKQVQKTIFFEVKKQP